MAPNEQIEDKDNEDRLKNVSFQDRIENPMYVKPFKMLFERRGLKLFWELAVEGDSVQVILYHTDRKQLLCVKQFRPAVFVRQVMRLPENKGKAMSEIDYEKYPLTHGMTLELCGGLMDKPNLSEKEIAIEEIYEELGFRPSADKLEYIQPLTSVGCTGAIQHLFFATISESDRLSTGGGNTHEGEIIEEVYLDLDKLHEVLDGSQIVPPIFGAGINWFINNKKDLIEQAKA